MILRLFIAILGTDKYEVNSLRLTVAIITL